LQGRAFNHELENRGRSAARRCAAEGPVFIAVDLKVPHYTISTSARNGGQSDYLRGVGG
jgi:hypothetical protein